MLFLDTMRGYDSTGVFGVDTAGNVGICKEASHGLDFILTKTFESFKRSLIQDGVFAVGHNRSATRGSITDKNAHPFWVDDKIVLVQNGTYKGDHTKLKATEVDTEAVAHVISETPSIEDALKKINASYALVWYNVDTKTLHMIRNSERPLYLLSSKNGALYWASESAFIYMALNRNNVQYDTKAESLPEYTLVSLTMDGKKWKRSDTKLNCEYKYSFTGGDGGSYVPAWMRGAVNGYLGMEEESDGYVPNTVISLPSPTKFVRNETPHSKSQCDATMAEIIADKYPEHHYDRMKAISIADACRSLDDGEQLIEVVDYVPANKHPECNLWHVFGHILSEPGNVQENAIAHWFLRDFTEQEVINYVADTFYMAKIASVKFSTFNDKIHVVTLFMSNAVYVKNKETENVH